MDRYLFTVISIRYVIIVILFMNIPMNINIR